MGCGCKEKRTFVNDINDSEEISVKSAINKIIKGLGMLILLIIKVRIDQLGQIWVMMANNS